MANDIEIVSRGNPFAVDRPVETSAITSVESAKAVAEVQARLAVAKHFPRDQGQAWARIMAACKRPGLAEKAMYQYPRGGQTVRGPSIRLAEELARSWGNIDTGIAELSRSEGSSEVEAYCWDLETNTRFSVRFTVRHLRDKKGGSQVLTDERDIYEIIANMGARRKRACILAAIPGDIIEDAVSACADTLANGGGDTLQNRVKKLLYAFSQMEISDSILVAYLGHPLDRILPEEVVTLRGIYQSLRDGQSKPSDWFKAVDKPTTNGASASLKDMAKRAAAQIDNGDPLSALDAELAQCPTSEACLVVQARWIAQDESLTGDIKKRVTARLKELA